MDEGCVAPVFTSNILGSSGLKRAAGTAPPLRCETHILQEKKGYFHRLSP